MSSPIISRINQLYGQGRFKEAIDYLKTHLSENTDDGYLKYLLAQSYYHDDQQKEARALTEQLISEDPENMQITELMANIDIAEEKYNDADVKADWLLNNDDTDTDYLLLKARVKFGQRYYDTSLEYTDKALELDAENEEALNLRILITNIFYPNQSEESVNKLLDLDPENPSSIANHGMMLLRQGNHKEALERFKEALSRQPSNQMARHGMTEALKSKFFLYRLIYKFFNFTSTLDGNKTWMLIIGIMIAQRVLRSAADNSEGGLKILLTTATIAVSLFVFLTWVINPIINLYLNLNPYGKLLLDDDDKTMAKYTGISLLIGLLSLAGYLAFKEDRLWIAGVLFIAMMIPLGTYLNPITEDKKEKLKYFTIALLVIGLLVIVFAPSLIFIPALGLIGYQFYYNSMMINDFSRKYE